MDERWISVTEQHLLDLYDRLAEAKIAIAALTARLTPQPPNKG